MVVIMVTPRAMHMAAGMRMSVPMLVAFAVPVRAGFHACGCQLRQKTLQLRQVPYHFIQPLRLATQFQQRLAEV